MWSNRAACFLRLQRFDKALQDAQVARTLDPAYAKVRRGAGVGQLRLAQSALARPRHALCAAAAPPPCSRVPSALRRCRPGTERGGRPRA